MVKLICVNSPSNKNYAHYNIKVGDLYDGELMIDLSSWPGVHGFQNLKYWKIYIAEPIPPIYSHVDSGEFMELSEYRNKQEIKVIDENGDEKIFTR